MSSCHRVAVILIKTVELTFHRFRYWHAPIYPLLFVLLLFFVVCIKIERKSWFQQFFCPHECLSAAINRWTRDGPLCVYNHLIFNNYHFAGHLYIYSFTKWLYLKSRSSNFEYNISFGERERGKNRHSL